MNKDVYLFPVLLVIACFLLFMAGGCTLEEVPVDEEKENVEEDITDEPPAEEARGNSAGNILNGGLVALQGDQLYFAAPGDGGKLYRAGLDGSEKIKLNEDRPRYINATDQYLYYVAMGEPEKTYSEEMGEEFITEIYGPVVRVNLDGGERRVICDGPAANLQLLGDKLYYHDANTEEPRIHRIGAGGGDEEPLTEHRADFFCAEDEGLYYRGIAEKPQLYRAALDGSEPTLFHDGDAYYMNRLDDYLYFVGDILEAGAYLGGRSLYRISTSGGEAVKVSGVEPALLNCAGDWLYYSKAHTGEICRIKPDGTDNALLSSDPCGGLFVFEHGLYYVNIGEQGSLYYMELDGSGRKKID